MRGQIERSEKFEKFYFSLQEFRNLLLVNERNYFYNLLVLVLIGWAVLCRWFDEVGNIRGK